MKKNIIFLLTAIGIGFVSNAQNITTFPYVEGFEDTHAGWVTIDGDGDNDTWTAVDYSQVPPFVAQLGMRPYEGTHALVSSSIASDENAPTPHPSNWAITPVFELPDMPLSLVWFTKEMSYSGQGDIYEVRLAVTGDEEVDTADFDIILLVDTLSPNADYTRHSINLGEYANSNIRIAFHHYNSSGIGYIQLDNVSLINDNMPMVSIAGPTSAMAGDTLTFQAIRLGGDPTNNLYTWIYSDVDYIDDANASTANIVWESEGTHTLGVVLANDYGEDTAWINVQVFDCSPVINYPYLATISDEGNNCWQQIDADGDYSGWEFAEGDAISYSATWGFNPQQDNWLIMRPLYLDPDSEYVLIWNALAPTSQVIWGSTSTSEHYGIWASTSNNPLDATQYTEIFSENLTAGSTPQSRHISLANYAGDTLYLAFRHYQSDYNELHISKVKVANTYLPIVDINTPTEIIAGDTLCFDLDTISFSEIYDITWSIETDPYDNWQEESTLDQYCYAWDPETEEGYYHIAVAVTNENGTSYDTAIVLVRNCGIIDTFPYIHQFGENDACWTIDGWEIIDNPIDVLGNNTIVAISYSQDDMMQSLHENHRLTTPRFFIPSDDTYELEYTIGENMLSGDRYSIIAHIDNQHDTLITETLNDNNYHIHRISLENYASQIVRFEFLHHAATADFTGYVVVLSDIKVQPLSEPTVEIIAPATARTIDIVRLSAQVNSAETLSYNWTINGATPSTSSDSSLTVRWNTPGTYTIILEAISSLFGSVYDTATIDITECNAQSGLPISENFDTDLGCWSTLDNDGDGHNWELFMQSLDNESRQFFASLSGDMATSWSTYPSQGILSMLFGSGETRNADNLLISPAITLGTESTYTLSFQTGSLSDLFGFGATIYDQYSVLLATHEPQSIDDFDIVLQPLTNAIGDGQGGLQQHIIDLSQYRDHTIYIAFRHQTRGCMALLLDNVLITNGEVTGIENADPTLIALYPNPATNILNIEAQGLQRIEILDLNGRSLMATNNTNNIDISQLSAGLYLVRATTANGVVVKKFIKQ